MPGMSVVELIARIKEKDQALPVVVMTGYPSLDAAINTMRQGASDFLIKPFNLHQIKATLERVVREQQLLKENLKLAERLKQKDEIENLNQELRRRIRQQNTVHQISAAIDRLQTSEDLYQGMADLAAQHLNVARSAVLLLDRTCDQLLIIAVHGYPPEVVGQTAGRLGQGISGKVAAEGEPMMGSPGGDPALEAFLPVRGDYFCLPINIREEVFGVFLAADKAGKGSFRGEDIFLGRFPPGQGRAEHRNIALYESMVANRTPPWAPWWGPWRPRTPIPASTAAGSPP